MKPRFVLYFPLLIGIIGCNTPKNKAPVNILHPDSLAAIQADFYTIEAAYNLTFIKRDSIQPQYEDYYAAVLKKHFARKSQLDSSIKFYSRSPEELNAIYSKTLKILEIRKINIINKTGKSNSISK